jgi:molecular chaperone HscB
MKILQKNLHPDLFSLKTEEEQKLSEEISSLVNKAYSTLQNPIQRAEYMLERRGIDSEMLERRMTSDVEFLTEVMELNERLEEIEETKDWEEFRKENDRKIAELNRELEEAFEKENIDGAVLILAKMKYYDNLQHKLKELQSRLGVVD